MLNIGKFGNMPAVNGVNAGNEKATAASNKDVGGITKKVPVPDYPEPQKIHYNSLTDFHANGGTVGDTLVDQDGNIVLVEGFEEHTDSNGKKSTRPYGKIIGKA